MFLAEVDTFAYSDPWNLPLLQRLRALRRGRQRVAYYYESPNNSSFRYRAYNMAQVLNHDNDAAVSASYFFQDDLRHIDEIADAADVLVICRSGYNYAISQLLMKFRARGKRCFFDVDDFVFNTAYTHLVVDTLGLDVHDPRVWDDWFGMMARMGQTLRSCDAAITTNDFLAARMGEFAAIPTYVVPNFMNQEQLLISDQLFGLKQARKFARDDTVHIAYFSGSPSHNRDYAMVQSALEAVLDADPRTRLVVVGYIEAGSALSRFGDRVISAPFQDYVNLQRLVARVEINLVPLQTNTFTQCKSELKFFEAAAVGTLSMASPVHNYAAQIRHGDNGYLAQAHQWQSAILHAISQLEHYPTMAGQARGDALEKFAWFKQRPAIVRALGLA